MEAFEELRLQAEADKEEMLRGFVFFLLLKIDLIWKTKDL